MPSALRFLLLPLLAVGLSSCLPISVGPRSLALTAIADDAPWTIQDLLTAGRVPRHLLRSLPDTLELAPLGSVIVACQTRGSLWGLCSHVTRKVGPNLLSEEPGPPGSTSRTRPVNSLLGRDVVFVLDTGVQPGQLLALQARADALTGSAYLLNGETDGFDCVTYQNALQRALGLPDVGPLNPRWNAHLPGDVLAVPTNHLLWVGVRDLGAVHGLGTAATTGGADQH
ncbi:hypothetical protein E7T09_01200 [Deinococcus sp. KSM4-11]|uniref:hypothetical protein n=1 Tax=Deinococcus sp. KSM4-11 TaxID=2568654 RepID=UPI0010A436F4|nr:hypothetical protein [Deinococcus sp. KSM4-11]THF87879.1 hypothetical protein E7T09_01200 [Deinococcus sp. KSM4-11]